jgi:hypothetical protein
MPATGRKVAFQQQNRRLPGINDVNCALWQATGAPVVLD